MDTTTSADPDVFQGALLVVAAAAGFVWALAHHGSGDEARSPLELKLPPQIPKHPPKHWRGRYS